MTGITFQGGNIGSTSYPKNNGIVNFQGGSQSFRLDHNHFNDTTYTPSVFGAMSQIGGTIDGVLDHNVLDLGGQSSVANGFQAFTTIGDAVGNGDGTWASATGWGTAAFLDMESNVVNGGAPNDCYFASRMTLRYNTFNNTFVAVGRRGHPTQKINQMQGQRVDAGRWTSTITLSLDQTLRLQMQYSVLLSVLRWYGAISLIRALVGSTQPERSETLIASMK